MTKVEQHMFQYLCIAKTLWIKRLLTTQWNFYILVHKTNDGEGKERLDKLDRISTIVLLLSEKAGWPKAIEQGCWYCHRAKW
jgi:hypothetical protein